jgi:transposase
MHRRAEGHGTPFTWLLTPGQCHEAPMFVPLLEQGVVKRAGPGRPQCRPSRVVGEKGYSRRAIRQYVRQHGIRLTSPRKSSAHRTGPFDRAIDRLRNRVERLIKRLKQFRRIATRDEKRAENYHTMVLIAAMVLWL